MADWDKLPYDIIHKVASYLEAIEDFFAFSAVCCSWRSVYLKKQWCPGPQVPWLMLSDNENSTITSFFSLYKNKVCTSELPETSGKQCFGTSSEWILTIGSDFQLHLLNVFTHVTKSLPPASTLQVFLVEMDWNKIINKALVIKKPCTSLSEKENLLVMIIFGHLKVMAFSRPGYDSWVTVEDEFGRRFTDFAYVKNQIYALSDVGALATFDIDGPHRPEVVYVTSPDHMWAWKQYFLVESSGYLWMVDHGYVGNHAMTTSVKPMIFYAYSFDVSQRQWNQLHNLGDHAIFLGDSCSMSIRAPDRLNCKCNSIYFAANFWTNMTGGDREECDLGVYDMTKGVAEPLGSDPDIPKDFPCSFWVIPTLG